MPTVLAWATGVAAIAAGLAGLIWIVTRFILPGARIITLIEATYPLLPQIQTVAKEWPDVKAQLDKIARDLDDLKRERLP